MEVLNASDAKREFGSALLKAQHSPVSIHKNGKPVAVIVSAKAYAELEALRVQHLMQAIDTGLADIDAGRVVSGKVVIQRMKKRISDGKL